MSTKAKDIKEKKALTSKLVLRITGGLMQVLLNIVFYVVIVILIVRGARFGYDFAYQVFSNETMDQPPGINVQIQIDKGEATMNVASKLEVSKLIKSKYSFYVKAKLKSAEIMPGTFALNTSMSYDEILKVITDQKQSLDYEEGTVDENQNSP